MPEEPSESGQGDRTRNDTSDDRFVGAVKRAYHAPETTVLEDADAVSPEWIAQYRIVSRLGVGGMGTVYEAEQQSPKRPVALKVVRGGRYVDQHYIRLFQREAQALARLRHPGIAAIFESGHTEDGQHFFAMELVRGEELHKHVTHRKLDLKSRLALFCTVCDAINYAHQRGVVHRDLKPSNILVDAEARPKVLDFGLARMTDTDINATTLVTDVGRLQGTLAYMSPEQARGNPDEIDLRSDVYALGVILYELVTDHLPFDLGATALHESVRAICDEAPRRPRSLLKSLPADVETIILKAMAKEPGRRYQSAASLGDDVDRFLANQPILARPPSAAYQLRKLAARHKVPFALLAALFVFVTGSGIWNRVLYRRAVVAQRLANEEAQISNNVLELLTKLVITIDPNRAAVSKETPRETLMEGAKKLETKLADDTGALALLFSTMGDVFRKLSYYDDARAFFEKSLAMQTRLHGETHVNVADAYNQLGLAWRSKGDLARAEGYFRKALEIHRNLFGDVDPHVARSWRLVAIGLIDQGRFQEASDTLYKALEIELEALGPEHIEIVRTKNALARLNNRIGSYVDAERLSRETWALSRKLHPADHPFAASAPGPLIRALRGRGAYAEAVMELRQALEETTKSHKETHRYFAVTQTLLGGSLSDQANYGDAEETLREALELFRDRGEGDIRQAAVCKIELGMVLIETGEIESASRYFSEALHHLRTQTGGKYPDAARARFGLALVALIKGQDDRAYSVVQEALSELSAYLPKTHWWVAYGRSIEGECLGRLGRHAEAKQLLERSYEMMRGVRGDHDRYVRQALSRVELIEEPGKNGNPMPPSDKVHHKVGDPDIPN